MSRWDEYEVFKKEQADLERDMDRLDEKITELEDSLRNGTTKEEVKHDES